MWNWIHQLEQFRIQVQPLVLVTITQCTGSTPRKTGTKMIVLPDGKIHGTIGGGHLEQLAIQDAMICIQKNESKTLRYPLGAKTGQCCGGTVELLFEVLNCGPRLYLFGAGHVGQALCRTLVGTPFSIFLIDERKEWLMSEQIPSEVIRCPGDWEVFIDEALWNEKNAFVAVMTHRHDLDQEIISKIIPKSAQKKVAFIGLIGSESKWARFQQRLRARGFSEEDLAQVHCPIGLSTGGSAPQEIAVSISAQLLKIYYEQTTNKNTTRFLPPHSPIGRKILQDGDTEGITPVESTNPT